MSKVILAVHNRINNLKLDIKVLIKKSTEVFQTQMSVMKDQPTAMWSTRYQCRCQSFVTLNHTTHFGIYINGKFNKSSFKRLLISSSKEVHQMTNWWLIISHLVYIHSNIRLSNIKDFNNPIIDRVCWSTYRLALYSFSPSLLFSFPLSSAFCCCSTNRTFTFHTFSICSLLTL